MDTFKNIANFIDTQINTNIGKTVDGKHLSTDLLKVTNKKEYLNFIYKTANTLFTNSQYESAIRFYEKLLSFKDAFCVEKTIRIYNNLMRCYAEEGPVEEVDRIFKQISFLDFTKIPLDQVFVSFYELAYSYYRRDECKTAIMIVDNAIKGYDDGEISKIKSLHKSCIDIVCKLLLLKTNILFTMNNFSECNKYVEILEEVDTEKKLYTYVTFFKGRTAAEGGRALEALKNYRLVINYETKHMPSKTGPIGSQVYLHIARLFYQIGKYHSSKKYFYKYLMQTKSGRSTVSNMLLSELIANYSFQEGNFREAESIFTKLLGSTVSHKTKVISFLTKTGFANLHLVSGNFDEAKITLDTTYKFIQSSFDDVNRRKLEIEWAKFFIAKSQYSKAIEIASRALPYFTDTNRNLELAQLYGIISRSYIAKKEFVEALKMISKQEKIAAKNFLMLDLLEAKLLKIICLKSLRTEHSLENELNITKSLVSKKIGGIVYMVIFSKIQGYIKDHTVFLRKNQDQLVKHFLKGLGSFHVEDDDHDIILDYKRKTIFEKTVGEIYMGNKGLLLRILLTLIERKGKVISKEELFEKVWKDLYNPTKHDNLIYININRLRKLIEPDSKKNRYILNTAGGYMFNDAVTFLIRSVNMDESLSKRQSEILDFIKKSKKLTIREYKDKFGISKSSAIRDLKRLKSLKLISEERMGNKSVFVSTELSH